MSFPNPDWMPDDHPQWRPVPSKHGIYIHDDCLCCEVEVIQYACGNCGETKVTMHRVKCKDGTDGHKAATKGARAIHATCGCGSVMG